MIHINNYLKYAVILMLLSGCSPVYEVIYSFTPPPNEAGVLCISQCEAQKNFCKQNIDTQTWQANQDEQRKQRDCEAQAEYAYQQCLWREKTVNQQAQVACEREDCTTSVTHNADYSACDSDHRDCYQRCGGQIKATRVCTAFCD